MILVHTCSCYFIDAFARGASAVTSCNAVSRMRTGVLLLFPVSKTTTTFRDSAFDHYKQAWRSHAAFRFTVLLASYVAAISRSLLTGAVVSLHAAPRVQLTVSAIMNKRIMCFDASQLPCPRLRRTADHESQSRKQCHVWQDMWSRWATGYMNLSAISSLRSSVRIF